MERLATLSRRLPTLLRNHDHRTTFFRTDPPPGAARARAEHKTPRLPAQLGARGVEAKAGMAVVVASSPSVGGPAGTAGGAGPRARRGAAACVGR